MKPAITFNGKPLYIFGEMTTESCGTLARHFNEASEAVKSAHQDAANYGTGYTSISAQGVKYIPRNKVLRAEDEGVK